MSETSTLGGCKRGRGDDREEATDIEARCKAPRNGTYGTAASGEGGSGDEADDASFLLSAANAAVKKHGCSDAAALFGNPTPAADALVQTARIAPKETAWHISLTTSTRSLIEALRVLDIKLNERSSATRAKVMFVISDGLHPAILPPCRDGDDAAFAGDEEGAMTIRGISANCVKNAELTILRHEADAVEVHPSVGGGPGAAPGETTVVLEVSMLHAALDRMDGEVVEMWQELGGNKEVKVACHVAQGSGMIWTNLKVYDAEFAMFDVPPRRISLNVKYQLYMSAANLKSVLDNAPRFISASNSQSKDVQKNMEVRLRIRSTKSGTLVLDACFGMDGEAAKGGGYAVPLHAMAPLQTEAEHAEEWAIINFKDSPDIRYLTAATGTESTDTGVPSSVGWTKSMRRLSLDELKDAEEEISKLYNYVALQHMLPSKDTVVLRIIEDGSLCISREISGTSMLHMLMAKTDLDMV